MQTPAVLLILDGFGISDDRSHNAILAAHTPTIDRLRERCSTLLEASGPAVGLPEGQMGSSEVNHLNMGAGRVVPQDIMRINNAIADGSFEQNTVLKDIFFQVRRDDRTLHLLGMVSDGGVHSHIDHLKALITYARRAGVDDILVHAILDGRDTAPRVAEKYLKELDAMKVRIASVMGRFYAMDRDHRWEREEKAYDTIVGRSTPHADSWKSVLKQAYADGLSDEFVIPTAILPHEMRDGDAVIFFNFRTDRTRELTRAFTQKHFTEFDRGTAPKIHFVQMTEYDKAFNLPTLFPPVELDNVLAEWLSKHDLSQLHIAETEKYAHVTFFFNGGNEEAFPKEKRTIVPSPKVRTYDEAPRMSIDTITSQIKEGLSRDLFDTYIVNFANADMVGHTGNFEATIKAVEAIDECIAELEQLVLEKNGFMIVTADHGNAEEMDGKHTTSHTLNKIPFIIVSNETYALSEGIVPDVAPTFLALMGLEKPPEMTGKNLIQS